VETAGIEPASFWHFPPSAVQQWQRRYQGNPICARVSIKTLTLSGLTNDVKSQFAN
jgi:hypothetical protein